MTYFFKAKANVNAAAGNSFAGGFGANGDGEVMIGVTYDADGNEKAMTVTGIGTVSGGLDLRGNTEDLSGLMGAINSAGGAAAGQAGKRIEFQSELDLTDPANRAAARAFIDGVNPATGNAVDLAQASIDLYERFDADAADQRAPLRREQDRARRRRRRLGAGLLGQVQRDRREPDRCLVRPGPRGLPALVRLLGGGGVMRRAAILLALALAGCGSGPDQPAPQPAPPDGFSRFEAQGVSFDHPRAWTRDEPAAGLTEFYGAAGEGGLPPQVAIGSGPARNDLADVVKLHKGSQKVRYPSYRVTRDEPFTLDGAAAAHVVDARYTMVMPGSKVLVRELNLLVLTEDGRALDFFVRSPAGDFAGANLQAIFDSFRLR